MKPTRAARLTVVALFCAVGMGPGAAVAQNLSSVNPELVAEPGCPVEFAASTRTELETDGSGAAVAARNYIDYKNRSEKTIAAVRFRVGYVDGAGKIAGVFNAQDKTSVPPGAGASQKWRGSVDPGTASVKMRVLVVQFDDGSVWESEKIKAKAVKEPEKFATLEDESAVGKGEGNGIGAAPAVATYDDPAPSKAAAGAPQGSASAPLVPANAPDFPKTGRPPAPPNTEDVIWP